MVKKNILFVCYGLGTGGIERCLVNLLNTMSPEKYNVDILPMNPEAQSRAQIKFPVHYLEPFRYVLNTTEAGAYARRHWSRIIPYLIFRILVKLRSAQPWKVFRALPKKYDIAIAYSHHDYSPFYVAYKVRAERKVLWYHTGIYEKSVQAWQQDCRCWSKFNYIVAVSRSGQQMLQAKFPVLSDRIKYLRNLNCPAEIRRQADEFVPASFKTPQRHIVTVGRLTPEKQPQLAVETCRKLVDLGQNICWHWVGDGNQRSAIEQLLAQYQLQKHFILEGNQLNPYPYIKHAEIYVQTSAFEGFSTTITEAIILAKPLVSTDVGGMRELITEGENGFLTPQDSTIIAEKIALLLNNSTRNDAFSIAQKARSDNYQQIWQQYETNIFY